MYFFSFDDISLFKKIVKMAGIEFIFNAFEYRLFNGVRTIIIDHFYVYKCLALNVLSKESM